MTTNLRRVNMSMSSLFNWGWVGHAANVAQLVGIPLAVIALGIAANQLREAAKTAKRAQTAYGRAQTVSEAQAVLALDLVLAQQRLEDLRANLAKGKMDNVSEEDEVALRRYVAALERLGFLVAKGVVNAEQAAAFYGSRLEKLIKNAPSAVEMAKQRPWENFIILWRTMENFWDKDDTRPKAPSLP
jgi:hypothetical protein